LENLQAEYYAEFVLAVKIGDNPYPNLIEDQANSQTEKRNDNCTDREPASGKEPVSCSMPKRLQEYVSF
jgi:hypothetical protein